MELLDFHAKKIKACFQFNYKGFIVSCSSIMNVNRVDIIFWDTRDELKCQAANTIPQAMAKIDNILDGNK